jgi:LysW-gamma-L-alpha-aminoadipyl-6-phosphate/LysW-L-glutamyl-5-phosphate reductase
VKKPIHVAILGASGYGAGELLRLLVQHPHATVVSVTSTTHAGEPVHAVHPHLRGFYDLVIAKEIDRPRFLDAEWAVLFSALPHGVSGTALDGLLGELRGPQVKAIDLSGDLRLKDAAAHQRAYPNSPLLPLRRANFEYGVPELNRQRILAADCVANPGCLATAAILAAAPLVDAGFRGPLVIDAKTGSSGAGRVPKETTHHPTRHADFRAYKPLDHQHEPEILQALGDPLGQRIELSFVPQSMAVSRGIFATVHVTTETPVDGKTLARRYEEFYAASPFVRLVPGSPTLEDVVGSNFCDIGIAARGRQVVVMSAIDNLIKGMAGTAIQNMNLMCGLSETTGLWMPSLRPV